MQPFWTQSRHPFAQWHAEIPADWYGRARIRELRARICEIGNTHQMFVVSHADMQSSGSSDFDFFGQLENAPGLLAYRSENDVLVDEVVRDVGSVQARLLEQVSADPETFQFTEYGFSPVTLCGAQLRYETGELPVNRPPGLYVELHSDIWFPCVAALSHPRSQLDTYVDNRELASINAPRFNSYLGDLRDLLVAAGSTWTVLDEDSRRYGHWLTNDGIALDAYSPPLTDPASLGSWKTY